MVDFGGLSNKAKEFLNSDKGEEVSDNVLQKAADAAKKATGGKYDDKIDGAHQSADDRIGQ